MNVDAGQDTRRSRSPDRLATRARQWARGLIAVTAGSMVAVTASAVPAAAQESAAAGQASAAGAYIVRAQPGHLSELVALLDDRHVEVQRRIGIIDAAVATLPAGAADALRADPQVASVTPNAALTLQATTYDTVADVNSLYNNENATKVRQMWSKGYTGEGVDVALIDSGVVAGRPGCRRRARSSTARTCRSSRRTPHPATWTPSATARTWPASSPAATAASSPASRRARPQRSSAWRRTRGSCQRQGRRPPTAPPTSRR